MSELDVKGFVRAASDRLLGVDALQQKYAASKSVLTEQFRAGHA